MIHPHRLTRLGCALGEEFKNEIIKVTVHRNFTTTGGRNQNTDQHKNLQGWSTPERNHAFQI